MFFIVGSARSGTTLLRLILNAHSSVAVPPESRFVVELWRGRNTVQRAEWLASLGTHPRFRSWDLPLEAIADEMGDRTDLPYAEAVECAYRAYAHVHGKTRWGDKTPRYVSHMPLLAELFPHARFVHLLRDGRDVALSYAHVPFGPKTVAKAARLWRDRVVAGISAGRSLEDGRYLELRYEDLVADAATQVSDLCDFLELDFEASMLDPTERARAAILPRAVHYNPHVTKPVALTRQWGQDMPPDQVEVFEAVAGDVLAELGYRRAYARPRRAAQARARLSLWGLPIDRLPATDRTLRGKEREAQGPPGVVDIEVDDDEALPRAERGAAADNRDD